MEDILDAKMDISALFDKNKSKASASRIHANRSAVLERQVQR